MAVNWTELFTDWGKILKYSNTYLTLGQTTLAADFAAIRSRLNTGIAGNKDALIADLARMYGEIEGTGGFKAQATSGWRGELARLSTKRLSDADTILNELSLNTSDLGTVLARAIDQMVIDAQTVNASVGGLGAVSAASGNQGNGTAQTSLVLDGISSPGQGMLSHKRYLGLNSELIEPDDMTFLCASDSQGAGGGRTAEGGEVFSWYGKTTYSPLGWEDSGAGSGGGIVVANAPQFGIVRNKDFEQSGASTTTGLFPGWTIDSGTPGTHVVVESTAADVYRGAKALRFDGDGAQASIQISQVIPLNQLKARGRYHFSLRYKASATIAAGQFTVQFEGTGYTAGATEKIDIAAGSLATSYTLANFFVNMPASIPIDGTFKIVIKWTGTPTAAKKLWIDSLTFRQPDWHNGHAGVIVAGSTPFKFGDRITYSVTNTEGTFQKWARLLYGIQWPSDNAGAETLPDSLAA
jgi:hypothetical protein